MQTATLTTGKLPNDLLLVAAFKIKAAYVGTRWRFITTDRQDV